MKQVASFLLGSNDIIYDPAVMRWEARLQVQRRVLNPKFAEQMPVPPKLTEPQKERLRVLEPALRDAARRGDYETAKRHTMDIQQILRPTGHESRLMQAKNWLFEAAMESGNLEVAESGFAGVRQRTSPTSRLYLEATALLAIVYLRQKKLNDAEPLIAKVLSSHNIRSESRRRRFLRHIVGRFEEEGLLGALNRIGRVSRA